MKALTGPTGSKGDMTIVPVTEANPSMTQSGTSPMPSSLGGGSLAPHRRSLEERQGGQIDPSAVSPQHFVNLVQQTHGRSRERGSSEVEIQFLSGSRVGAYLLANHSSHASLLTAASRERSHFTVRQNALFRANPIVNNPRVGSQPQPSRI